MLRSLDTNENIENNNNIIHGTATIISNSTIDRDTIDKSDLR